MHTKWTEQTEGRQTDGWTDTQTDETDRRTETFKLV